MTVFIHAPKTGGMSVRAACDAVFYGHEPRHRISKQDFSFGFVRNPWDRMVSLFYFLTRVHPPLQPLDGQKRLRAIGFKRWLLDAVTDIGGIPVHLDPGQTLQTTSQMWWLDGCDRIGRFKNLENDLRAIGRDLGFYVRNLPHKNRSPRGNYRRYYDDETQAFVAKHFAHEIEQFGYKF